MEIINKYAYSLKVTTTQCEGSTLVSLSVIIINALIHDEYCRANLHMKQINGLATA